MSTETPSDYAVATHYIVRVPAGRLRCMNCGHRLSAYDIDVIEPTNLIRVTCGHCCVDLLILEIR
jgi:hypothetical protein